MSRQKQGQAMQKPVGRRPTQGQPAVTTVTAAIRGPVSRKAMPCVTASASASPPTSFSTVVTTVSSAIMSIAVAVQAENSPIPVCSEMGVNQPPNSIGGIAETITPVPEDLVRGVNSVAGAHPEVATLYNQHICGITSGVTDVQNSIMVTMLSDALQTVKTGMQHSDPVTRVNDSIVQSLLQCIQQLESSNVENVVLHQRIVDLETQAYQAQNLVAVHQKQETRSSDNPVVTDAVNKSAKHKRKWSKKSRKKSHLASSVSSSSQSSAESSDSDSDGDTEALLSTSSQKRCGAPKSG